uniref:hypothetical protein n=1 Tax=Desulfobacter vibrioformis TaxID=34031 RepID=UPI00054DC7DA
IAEADALLVASPNGAGTTNALTALLPHIAGKGTVPNTTALVTAVAANGTLAEIQNMITACPVGGAAITDMTTAVARNAVTNTPNNIRALLLAVATLVRFNAMIATLNFFHHPLAAGGLPATITKWNTAVTQRASFNSWNHVLTRHTYNNFNFGAANVQQGFYAPGTAYAGLYAIIQPLINGLSDPQIANINLGNNVNTGGYRIGGGGANHWIPTIFPTGAAHQVISLAEANALNNLR